jgi:hypothetical protein
MTIVSERRPDQSEALVFFDGKLSVAKVVSQHAQQH